MAAAGLRLLDNPFAAHVALALGPAQEAAVLRPDAQWQSNNVDLPRDTVALLVLLWALLVLPKRERQLAREAEGGQGEMFTLSKESVRMRPLTESSLYDDFSERLGGRQRMRMNLGRLKNAGFIDNQRGQISEGPLLDLVFDYGALAPRLLDGVLGDLVRRRASAAAGVVHQTSSQPIAETGADAPQTQAS